MRKKKFFKHLIFFLIPISIACLILALIYILGKMQYRRFDDSNQKVQVQLAQLSETMVAYKDLQAKIKDIQKKGVGVDSVASESIKVNQLIASKEYLRARENLASYSAALDDLYSQKLEEDKKKVEAAKVKFDAKLAEYKGKGVNVSEVEKESPKISDLIAAKQFDEAQKLIDDLSKKLDQALVVKQEADRKAAEEAAKKAAAAAAAAAAAPAAVMAGSGYQHFTIATDRGNFSIHLVKIGLSGLRIITDTADSSECSNNCTAKPLANYVSENGGFAGINGTYFCPPDYGWCAGKTNTFDCPVYNTRIGKLLHADKLFWNDRSMFVFDPGGGVHFYPQARDYDGATMKAAIANFPGLVNNKQNIVNNYSIDDKSRMAKITRDGIGTGGGYIWLVSAQSATVPDLASVFMALGVDYALNLDGGGSSALYYGGYKVGPGRALPNAVVFAQ